MSVCLCLCVLVCVCDSMRCDLCLAEKVKIMRKDPELLLNKRSEMVSKYRHKNKFILANIK